jgi:2'-5' RNA ligase
MREIKDVRIFFALWPDEEVRRKIVELLPHFDLDPTQSRFLKSSNIHMTLHFIGNSSHEQIECLRRQAKAVAGNAFVVDLDCQGYFSKPKVLWIGCNHAPRALPDLQARLGQQLSSCGFIPERRPFNPHVTIARKLPLAPQQIEFEPISWKVDRFVLVESKSIPGGVQYQVIEEYPLQMDRM